jgi:pimeloyl-ACP methyl ester carboxylesterase
LRFLGKTLAANGIPAMRFDLPGTGDSSGGSKDPDLADAWIQSISDAARELREMTGVRDVAVIGVRLGATLAVAAASRGADLQDLVLWGPSATGRSILRELRAFQQMEQSAVASAREVREQAIPGLEVAGFLLSPGTERSLESLDLSVLPSGNGRRVMVLTRDNLPPDGKLVRALETSGSVVEIRNGTGYAAMLAEPHDAVPPVQTSEQIVDFLTQLSLQGEQDQRGRVAAHTALTKGVAEQRRTAAILDNADAKLVETMFPIENSKFSIFGTLSASDAGVARSDLGLLFLNAGAVRHIGPNRMWVDVARRWALQGIPSLRLDFKGIGEADTESSPDVNGMYQGNVVEQIEVAMDLLRSQLGIRRFAVIGLCSGAFWGFHATVQFVDVRAAILLNPRLFFWDPNIDRRRMLRRTVDGFTSPNTWNRLARGKISKKRINQAAQAVLHRLHRRDDRDLQISPSEMRSSLASIQRNKSRLTLIFSEDEPLLREMEEESWLPPENNSCFRCIRVPDAGHTFRPLWAQDVVHRLIDSELELLLEQKLRQENQPSAGVPEIRISG